MGVSSYENGPIHLLVSPSRNVALANPSGGWTLAAVARSQFDDEANVVLYSFPGIFLQMLTGLGFFYSLASGSLGSYRFQLSIFFAISLVFAVLGVAYVLSFPCNSHLLSPANSFSSFGTQPRNN